MTACSTPSRASEWLVWSPPGPLLRPFGRDAQAPGFGLQHPEHHLRKLGQERLDRRPGNLEAAQQRRRLDVCVRRLVEQHADLAEEFARAEPDSVLAVDPHD